MIRLAAISVMFLFGLVACGEDFVTVQKQDTIEAYEKFQAENPTSIYNDQINIRLDELYSDRARTEGSVAAWDAYLAKFPKGKKVKEAEAFKEDAAWDAAEASGTADAYNDFLAKYATATKPHKDAADQQLAIAAYGKLVIAPPNVTKLNAAEDPKGELNIWGLKVDVKNEGDKPINYLVLETRFFGPDGAILEVEKYGFVSPPGSNRMPHPEIEEKPLKPGESRTWVYMATEKVPLDVNPTAKVRALNLQLAN
jgi:hypothetical protein